MTHPPQPVVFTPICKAKPWGGRRLADLFDKTLPADEKIGETWELSGLPGNESVVRDGPLAGTPISQLMSEWRDDLLGGVSTVDGGFPLLIKFLDAREHLSVQVHPKPAADDPAGRQPGIKHEAWFILDADPGAQLYVGLKDGVTAADVARVANTPEMVDVLRTWNGKPGQCYYLPSGTLHALGAGLVVAEVQTPSDITYRTYDWGRVGLDGKPRELHIEQSLANIRYDVTEDMIVQPPHTVSSLVGPATRMTACERFVEDLMEFPSRDERPLVDGAMRIWIVLAGGGELVLGDHRCRFRAGNVVLIPAACAGATVRTADATRCLEVTIPPTN